MFTRTKKPRLLGARYARWPAGEIKAVYLPFPLDSTVSPPLSLALLLHASVDFIAQVRPVGSNSRHQRIQVFFEPRIEQPIDVALAKFWPAIGDDLKGDSGIEFSHDFVSRIRN